MVWNTTPEYQQQTAILRELEKVAELLQQIIGELRDIETALTREEV